MTAETLPRCPHGIYLPKGQKFAHGCYQCNADLAAHDPDPQKTEALFKLEHGGALAEFRDKWRNCLIFKFGPPGYAQTSKYGGIRRPRELDVYEPVRVSFKPGIKSEFAGLRRDWRW